MTALPTGDKGGKLRHGAADDDSRADDDHGLPPALERVQGDGRVLPHPDDESCADHQRDQRNGARVVLAQGGGQHAIAPEKDWSRRVGCGFIAPE